MPPIDSAYPNNGSVYPVNTPAFAKQQAVSRTVVDAGHEVLPDVPPAGELELRSGKKNRAAHLR